MLSCESFVSNVPTVDEILPVVEISTKGERISDLDRVRMQLRKLNAKHSHRGMDFSGVLVLQAEFALHFHDASLFLQVGDGQWKTGGECADL